MRRLDCNDPTTSLQSNRPERGAGVSMLPLGYRAAGLPRHDRPRPSRHGLAIFYSDRPAAAGAAFTTNRVKSAHILVDQKQLKKGDAQVVMVNSGCANCCTGKRGIQDAEKTILWASQALDVHYDK